MENIEIYFESIKQVYNQILEWEKERENRPEPVRQKITTLLIGTFLVFFLLSLIPIIPIGFVFIGGKFAWNIGSFDLSQATILTYCLAWLLSTIGSFILFMLALWMDNKINPTLDKEKDKAPQTLSAEQLTFIFIYQAYKELKIFFVSHIDQHVQKCSSSLNELERPLIAKRFVDEERYIHSITAERYYPLRDIKFRSTIKNRLTLIHQNSIAREFLQTFEKYSWFHIDDLTKSRLQALISFQKKIIIRLEKREDLPAVLTLLENLSKFLYAFLPEHQANMNLDDLNALQTEGTKCLDKFAQDTDKLIDYPTKPHGIKIERHVPKPSAFQKLQVVYFSNIFFRFAVWLIFLLIITTGLVFLVSLKIFNLNINVMVSMVIATSITGAAALAVTGVKNTKASQETVDNRLEKLQNSTEIEIEK